MTNFAIVGILGRMGQVIANLSLKYKELNLIAGYEHPQHKDLKKNYADVLFLNKNNFDFEVETIQEADLSNVDGVIDFSLPKSAVTTAQICAEKKIPLVIGATGWSDEQLQEIKQSSKNIPILQANNMSIGVNMLFALTQKASASLHDKGFVPEITEIHHKHKKDAPSGTAVTLEEIVLDEYSMTKENSVYGRKGIVGERPDKQIGVHALRGGDVVGEHTVFFFGENERIEIKHQATSRDVFAKGALEALIYIQSQKAGLYDMQKMLGL